MSRMARVVAPGWTHHVSQRCVRSMAGRSSRPKASRRRRRKHVLCPRNTLTGRVEVSNVNEHIRRHQIKETLCQMHEQTIEERVNRYLEVAHQRIIANHHFAAASTECLNLYRDGYFLSTLMMTQAVAEGVFRFVVERNALTQKGERPEMAACLVERNILTQGCADAFVRIWKSFRNDVHHMNPNVAKVPFPDLAKRSIADLATIEREIFAFRVNNGKPVPIQPKYWDPSGPDGTTTVFLRLSP